MERLIRVLVIAAIGAIAGVSLAAAGIAVTERFAGSTVERGRIVDRSVDERRVCGNYLTGPRCRMEETATVIGEREDGTRWEVIGDRAYEITDDRSVEVVVTTSDVTGRVMSVSTGEKSWQYAGTWWLIGFGLLGAAAAIAGTVVVKRGRANVVLHGGAPRSSEWWSVVPGALIGMTFAANAIIGGLTELESSADTSISGAEFLLDRFDLLATSDSARARAGTSVNELFRLTQDARLATVAPDHLNEIERQAWMDTDAFAIPLWQEGDVRGARTLIRFFIVDSDDTRHQSIGCPEGLTEFPTRGGAPSTYGGFVCFEPSLTGATLLVTVGSLQLDSERIFPDYPLADDTIVSSE